MSSAQASAMVLLNSSGHFKERDVIRIRIDLHNGYGRLQQNGGDGVRVWISEPQSHKSLLATVTDLNNGSYIASFEAFFTGSIEVRAAVVHPGVYLRNVLSLIRQGTIQYTAGLFKNGSHSEVTLCRASPILPNYTAICNLTQDNNNISWFCGHPFNPNLSCNNWASVRVLPSPKFPSLLFQKFGLSHLFPVWIPGMLKINVTKKNTAGRNLDLPPCTSRSRPLLQSWLEHSPRGWTENNSWHPYSCTVVNLSTQLLSRCLNGTTVLILGNSPEAARMFEKFRKSTACTMHDSIHPSCKSGTLGVKIMSHPFAHPMYEQTDEWVPKTVVQPILDKIPETGHLMVVIDHTIPSAAMHHSEYRYRVRKMVEVTQLILDRCDTVQVAVLGPEAGHSTTKGHHQKSQTCSDCFALKLFDILKEEYVELRKNVLYLDGWDMSSIKNLHGSVSELDIRAELEKIKLLLNYFCDNLQD